MLHDGFISSVTARIPWPNPLTSTLGFSVESLHLTFHLRQKSNTSVLTNPVLANSVASVAESFMQEELTPQEEATLLESFHPDLFPSIPSSVEHTNLPGGLDPDPFLSSPEDDTPNTDVDPDGVSIFAALFERLLARFEFHVVNTKITLIQPGNISITVSIPEFRYRTEDGEINADVSRELDIPRDKSRNITMTGLTVTANSLRAPATMASSLSTFFVQPPSSSSSSPVSRTASPAPASPALSCEGDTRFEMSQSIASLLPRHSSPTGSITSSMYQSALSTPSTFLTRRYRDGDETEPRAASQRPETRQSLSEEQSLDVDVIVSFGSHPILIKLCTDPSVDGRVGTSSTSQEPLLSSENAKHDEILHISVVTGVVACAFQGWHIQAISDFANCWTANQSKPDPSPSSIGLEAQPDVLVTFESFGLVLLVLPPALVASFSHQNPGMAQYFEQPLLPSTFPHGYLRLFLETITGSVKSAIRADDVSFGPHTHIKQRQTEQAIATSTVSFQLSVGDISLFSIDNGRANKDDISLDASPVLITDSNLPFQYEIHHRPDVNGMQEHPHLPTFKIVDQMDQKHRHDSILWRSKGSHKRSITKHTHKLGSSPITDSAVDKVEASPNARIAAFKVDVKRQEYLSHQRKPVLEVDIHAVPMHIFVDLGQVLGKEGNWSFLSEVIGIALDSTDEPSRSDVGERVSHQVDPEADTPPASPQSRSTRDKQKERQRRESFVLKDLDLDLDYRVKEFNAEGRRKGSRKVELCCSALFNISYRFSAASHSPDNFEGVSQD